MDKWSASGNNKIWFGHIEKEFTVQFIYLY